MAKIETLIDTFNDNSLDATKWHNVSFVGLPNETNNRLQYELPSGFTNRGLETVNAYDITDSFYLLELYNVQQYFEILSFDSVSSDAAIDLYIQSGLVYMWLFDGPTTVFYDTFVYSSTPQRWWRIRNTSGVVYFESSPNGSTWTIRGSSAYSGDLTSQKVMMYAANPNGLAQTTYLDNFNKQRVEAEIVLDGSSTIMGADPYVTYYPEVTLTGSDTVEAYGRVLADQSQVDKTYLYKVYDADDTFLGVWDDVISDLNYDHEINSAGSTITVDLARNSDSRSVTLEGLITTHSDENITTQDNNDIVVAAESVNKIGPGSNVDVNYRVEIWVFYGESTELSTSSGEIILTQDNESIIVNLGAVSGLRKFHGYIVRYNSRYGDTENVRVAISSFGRELDNFVLESGSNTTVAYNSTDPSNILIDALDKFNIAGGVVSYESTTIDLTGTSVTYTFRLNTYLEVIKKTLELAPYDWYWYVGLGDDNVYFAQKPSTATHTFILGQHLEQLDLEYSIEDITNVVYFTGGEVSADTSLFKKYTDATSISNYRQGLQRISDARVTLDTSADLISEAEIERDSTPRYRTSVTILDDVYDIESINLGELIKFRNFGNYIDDLELQIVGISYEPDRVTLQLDTLLPSVNKRIEDLRRNMVEQENQQIPSAPS